MTDGIVGIVGGGKMGGAILTGLLQGGRSAETLLVAEAGPGRAAELREVHGVEVTDLEQVVLRSQIVLLVIKPADVRSALQGAPLHAGQIVVSLAAGIPLDELISLVPKGVKLARVMPNAPALIGEGIAAVTPGPGLAECDVRVVQELLAPVGRTLVIPEEWQDAATAVSGSGPAYLFHLAEAMIEAGVRLGLPRQAATELTSQTLVGSAKMVRDSGRHPVLLRDDVTSPGGTTSAASAKLDEHAFSAAVSAAMVAARDRSLELGRRGVN